METQLLIAALKAQLYLLETEFVIRHQYDMIVRIRARIENLEAQI